MLHIRNNIMRLSKKYFTRQQLIRLIPYAASFLVALLSGVVLFGNTTLANLDSFIINVGLDPLRAQFTATIIVALFAAGIGGAVGRRRWLAMSGSGLVFCFAYLFPFIQLQRQPVYDPGGHLEVLNAGALVHTSFVMAALALLSAFIGAAIGIALGETLLDPFYQLVMRLVMLIWPRIEHEEYVSHQGRRRSPWLLWTGAVVMIALILLASGSSDIFLYAPDTGLHAPPKISSTGSAIPAHGTILDDSLLSPALNNQKKIFKVYLPPSYNTPQGQNKRYPTLYLLHGSPGSDIDWFKAGDASQSADTLIATGQIPELIIVAPDGNGCPGGSSEWGNSFDGKQLIETFVAIDLVNYVDQHYRTISSPGYRAIGGNSMGGFGAMNIALHHPDVFGAVISLGGYYRAEGNIWGNNAAYMRANSPADIIPTDKAAWKLHMFIGAATKDQPYYTDSLNFVKEIGQFHIQYHLDIQKGYHSWKTWQIQMYNALRWLKWG